MVKSVLDRQFSTNVAMVLLLSFVVIEVASFVGWSHGVTSVFRYPMNKILSLLALSVSLSGAYFLSRDNKVGVYFALFASVFWVVLGGFSLVKAYGPPLNQALVTHGTATIVLGFLTLVCIFKSNHNQQKRGLSASADTYAVETVNVAKKYFLGSNIVSAVNGLSMVVQKGEFIAIMGPSGSGKSTLLNLIGALDRPSSGQVLIDGVDISILDEEGLAKLRNEKIGFVFQAYNLIARSSVLRNMELPVLVKGSSKKDRLKRVNGLLSIVGLHDKASRKPQTLSGGEQQRVAIARALINNPEIVLADEPTGNVDSKTGQVIMDYLRKLNEQSGTTVIVVTHDSEVAGMADRVVYLRDGNIV